MSSVTTPSSILRAIEKKLSRLSDHFPAAAQMLRIDGYDRSAAF
jgi:hypothetical protein